MTTVPHGRTTDNRLVVFAPNWLGDAVMALPAVADLRCANPEAFIAVAARPSVAPLFTLAEGIDAVIDIERADLRALSFDRVLLLPNSFRAALLSWRAGIPERWGYRTQGRGALLTRAIPCAGRMHQVAYYQHLVNSLGYASGPMRPEIRISPDLRQAGARMLSAAGWDGLAPLIALAPGAANGRAKQWPPASFARVARELEGDGVTTVLVGTASDVRAGADLLEALGERSLVMNLIGRTDLPALAGVLVNCRALVCNDSGAMHFAAALGVNVTAMFGPTNEVETRPTGQAGIMVLTHDVWCRPCMLRDCPLDHRCMRGITTRAVVDAARAALQ